MLIKLKLENIALIEIIEINFEKGLNIFTGDSGSGKSLILDSLNVLFGGTNIPLKHLIRPGKEDCSIEAKFSISSQVKSWLHQKGFKNLSSELNILRRSYKKNNKIISRFTLNDIPASKQLLEELGLLLIDFAGQSDGILFDSYEYRRLIIDDLGSNELREINLKVKNTWKKYQMLKGLMKEKIDNLNKQKENNLAVKEMLNILDQANLSSSGEIIDLEKQEDKLANNFEIINSIQESLNHLNNCIHEEQSIGFLISKSIKKLNKVVEFDTKIEDFRDKLLIIQDQVETLTCDFKSYIQNFEKSEVSLDEIQKRLFFLKNLEKTFSLELPELILKRKQLHDYFSNQNCDDDIKVLEREIKSLQNILDSLFILQSSERKQIAHNLQNSVMAILKNLGLENAFFSIQFEEVKPTAEGIEKIKFFFSANPDQKLAPLSKIISGGEMSRFLLAIKSIICKQPNTFFLDEIDNGLSGKSLSSLVKLIQSMSQRKQVLCITHQPFLAAAGKAHFKVKKNVINGLTYTSIAKLRTKKERQKEIIELIGSGFSEANDYASTLLDIGAA